MKLIENNLMLNLYIPVQVYNTCHDIYTIYKCVIYGDEESDLLNDHGTDQIGGLIISNMTWVWSYYSISKCDLITIFYVDLKRRSVR